MGLFNLEDSSVVVDPDVLGVPPVKKIWDRDKSKKKEKAYKELSYVYFLCDFNSPYAVYPEHKKREVLAKDIMKDLDYVPDNDLEYLIQQYRDFYETTSMRLIRAARTACDKLSDYFEHIDFKELDDDGRPVYTAKDVAMNLAKVGDIVNSLDKLEDKVQKEIKSESKIKGGGDVGSYER